MRRVSEGLTAAGTAVLLALIAVPVLWGIAGTVDLIVRTPEPYKGWGAEDIRTIWTGQSLYQDPAEGHVALLYTPLYFYVCAGLLHLVDSDAIPLLLTGAAAAAIAGIAGGLAFRGPRLRAAGGAVLLASTSWWLLSSLDFDNLWTNLPDHSAWLLAVAGLLVLARVPDRPRAAVPAVVLLTAAVWTKQTAATAAVAGAAWLVLLSALAVVPVRVTVATLAGLALANVAVLVGLAVATDGWSTFYVLEVGQGHFQQPLLRQEIPPTGPCDDCGAGGAALLRQTALGLVAPAALALALGLCALAAAPRPRLREIAAGAWRERTALLLVLFVAVTTVGALVFQRKQGTHHNQLIGAIAGLCLLSGLAWGHAQRSRARALAALGVLALGLVLQQSAAGRARDTGLSVPPLRQVTSPLGVPGTLQDLARVRRTWHPDFGALNARRLGETYPALLAMSDLVAAGHAPSAFERALLERRFEALYPLGEGLVQLRDPYTGGYGSPDSEQNYLRKLERAMALKYVDARSLDPREPEGLLVPRPGPDPAPWLSGCFGPFELAGTTWQITTGGGLWCEEGGGRVRVREPYGAFSRLRTERAVELRGGRVTVRPRTGPVELRQEVDDATPLWQLQIRPAGGGAEVDLAGTVLPLPRSGELRVERGGTGGATLRAEGDAVVLRIPPRLARGRFAAVVSAETRAVLELGGLQVRPAG